MSSASSAATSKPGPKDHESPALVPDDPPLRGANTDKTTMRGWGVWRNSFVRRSTGSGHLPASPATTPTTTPTEEAPMLILPSLDPAASGPEPITPTTAPPMSPGPVDPPQLSLASYIVNELDWGSTKRTPKPRQPSHTTNFVKIPMQLESFLGFGFLLCLDVFLHNFTFLPLRLLRAVWVMIRSACCARGQTKKLMHRAEVYDLLRLFIIVFSCWVLTWVQLSRVYHYIRGEAIIKLYVIFNILEIFDKLLCSVGQDIMNSLYRNVRDHSTFVSTDLVLCIAYAVVYVLAHSVLLFVQLVSLNIAINSQSNALLTLLVSNNFVELKASVFKRFEPENLFQICCSDVVERFQLTLFLLLILLQDAKTLGNLYSFLPSAVGMFLVEVAIDWFKHGFIAKFNRIHADNYSKFHHILSHDIIVARRKMNVSLDPTHGVVRRLGFASIPLMCVVIRFCLLSDSGTGGPFQFMSWVWESLANRDPYDWLPVTAGLLLISCVVALKVLVSIVVLGYVATIGDGGLSAYVAPAFKKNKPKPPLINAADAPSPIDPSVFHPPFADSPTDDVIARVAKINRYTLHRNRIPL